MTTDRQEHSCRGLPFGYGLIMDFCAVVKMIKLIVFYIFLCKVFLTLVLNLVSCIGVDFVNHDIGQKSWTGYYKARARKYSELFSSVVQYGEGVICFIIVHYGEGVTFLSVVQYGEGVTLLSGFSKKLLGFNPLLIWDLGNTELFILYCKVHIMAGTSIVYI